MKDGGKLVFSIRNDYAVTPVTTGAYVQIHASIPANARIVEIFDSSGSTLQFSYGPAGSEVVALNVVPGGNELRPCLLNQGMALSLKAIDASATVGEFVLNAFY